METRTWEGITTVVSNRGSPTPISFVSLGSFARVKLWKLRKQSKDACCPQNESDRSLAPDVSGYYFPGISRSCTLSVVVVQYEACRGESRHFLHHEKVAGRLELLQLSATAACILPWKASLLNSCPTPTASQRLTLSAIRNRGVDLGYFHSHLRDTRVRGSFVFILRVQVEAIAPSSRSAFQIISFFPA
eukprot:765988-Hanusia_phi.AAC.16